MITLFKRSYLLNLIRNKVKPDNLKSKHKAHGRYHFSKTPTPSSDTVYFSAAYSKVGILTFTTFYN